ncbi:MAG: PEP-CTERM sorting domain-containing protein [Crocosphaera sp.]|nr:PEP-CTERM sorting domain-containing protein [Crocosphaera sp.]
MSMLGFRATVLGATFLGATAIALGVSPAQAASFTGFASSPTGHTLSPNVADTTKGDIRLDSVTKNGQTLTEFRYVTGATIIENGTSLGPGSSDHGDLTVSDPFLVEGPAEEMPDADDVVASLGNNNLNSIIDTEEGDSAASIFDVYFSDPTQTFVFWERGKNSALKVTAILAGSAGDLNPTLGGSFTITQDLWTDTGIMTTLSIDTTEIGGNNAPQELGTYGLMYDQAIIGLRLEGAPSLGGPDYKVVGVVPEPLTILGAGTAIAIGGAFKRKLRKKGSTKA